MKKKLVYALTILFSVLFIAAGYAYTSSKYTFVENTSTAEKAKIVRINDEKTTELSVANEKYRYTVVYFTARILSGENKGQSVDAAQVIDEMYLIQMGKVKQGSKIILCENFDEKVDTEYIFSEFIRTDSLIILGLVFCLLLLIFGRMKGANTLISLAFTCLAVFLVFIPSVLSGLNIYFWSILICIFITVMTLLLVNGADAKSLAAGAGCIGGVIIAGGLMKFMDLFLHLTGQTDECSIYLQQLNPDDPIDLKALIFAAIIIGAVGAIMDVAMSMASSLYELHEKAPDASAVSLMRSGLSIGRDIMGTMANTLVLAYIGSSLCTVLLLFVYDATFLEIMNKELIIVQILQSLVGSFGILFAIPFTTAISALLYTGGKIKKPAIKYLGTDEKSDGKPKKEPQQNSFDKDFLDSLY
ncbi:MAG: YibE/F family protein [Clostridia bacterium]|nr:YibE/F family protein [Clostridia bacterium]